MMKSIFVLLILIFTHCVNGQSLKIVYGDRLFYQTGNNIYEIKKLKDCSSFRGYDIIDSLHIFLAYDPETSAEASTKISVYNIETQKEKVIDELGGTGESFFVYNKKNDMVLLNLSDGLYIFKLHNSKKEIVDKLDLKKILNCTECFLPFWIDSKILGYQKFENGHLITKYFEIDYKNF